MAARGGSVHVATTKRVYKGKTYVTHLLRRSIRKGKTVTHETLGNLSHLPDHLIEIIKRSLKGETFVPAADAFRMAAHALFDDWRQDPAVTARPARRAEVSARSRIPAVIDGEPTLLGRDAVVVFTPKAFRALAPSPEPAQGPTS